jgi:trmH family RNA methyltransferase
VGEPAVLSKVPSEANAVDERVEVTAEELARVSLQRAPQGVLAVFEKPQPVAAQSLLPVAGRSLCLALDGVQDPGNVGTIVRIADWWGIEHVICSHDTADVFAPKTVQSTMGALGRVGVHYTDLPAWLDELPAGTPVYGTLLDGDNLYDSELTPHGIIVMGNEGNGLSSAVRERVSHRLLIPSFPPDRPTSESLNVAVATAVTCAEFRRRS